MVSQEEMSARIKDFFRFERNEVATLFLAAIVTAFIFSFRDWGTIEFDVVVGLRSFFLVLLAMLITFAVRTSLQKLYGLSQGYKVMFKVWPLGLFIALVIAFITLGRLPLVLIGGITSIFMIKQRLGEFRFGASYKEKGTIALWGILGNMIVAIVFALGLYFSPQSYFFYKGMLINIIMGFSALLPLPRLEGLTLFFGSRLLYYVAILLMVLTTILLITRTKLGLILAITLASLGGIFYFITSPEK